MRRVENVIGTVHNQGFGEGPKLDSPRYQTISSLLWPLMAIARSGGHKGILSAPDVLVLPVFTLLGDPVSRHF
jgi:hypothetical protein